MPWYEDYDRDYRGYAPPSPGAGWYGPAVWGWGAFPSVPWWGGWPPFAPVGYGTYERDYTPRRRPEESRTYGRGGDRAVRDWARSRGYGVEYEIRPRRRARGYGREYRGYDRSW